MQVSKKFIVIVSIFVLLGVLTFAAYNSKSFSRPPEYGVIVRVNDSFVTVKQNNGELKIYPLPENSNVSCDIDDAWPDCLPAF